MALLSGNLLPEAMQSMDTMDGWAIEGATGVLVPNAVVSPDPEGALRLTATGAGTSVLETEAPFPLVPSSESVGWIWYMGSPRTGGLTLSLVWLDDDEQPVGTPASRTQTGEINLSAPGRVSVHGYPPDGATQVRFRLEVDTEDATQFLVVDGAYLGNPVPSNLLTYGDYSAEDELPPWVSSGSTAPSREYHLTNLVDGLWTVQVPAELGTTFLELERFVPVEPGVTYMALTDGIAHSPNTPEGISIQIRVGVRFYDADHQPIPPSHEEPFTVRHQSNSRYLSLWSSRTATAPAHAAYANPTIEFMQDASSTTEFFLIDKVSLRVSAPAYELSVHDALGYVELRITSDDEFEGTYTAERIDEDGSRSLLRTYGAETYRLPWVGEVHIEDYEAPVSSRVHYLVRVYAPGASDDDMHSYWITRTVTAPHIADTNTVWLKSPGQPAYNLRALMLSAPAWERPAVHALHPIVGRSTPVALSAIRASKRGSITLMTTSLAQRDLLDTTLGMGQPMLLQAAPGHGGITGNLYIAVGDVGYAPDGDDGLSDAYLWELDVTEIDRPAGGLQGSAGRTWQTVEDDHETWVDVDSTYSTWSGVATGNEG